jgi:hypothetical protein
LYVRGVDRPSHRDDDGAVARVRQRPPSAQRSQSNGTRSYAEDARRRAEGTSLQPTVAAASPRSRAAAVGPPLGVA